MTTPPAFVTTEHHPYALFFDGECCFCNRWVGRIMKVDTERRTRFGAKQGVTFQQLAAVHPEVANVRSIVLVKRDASGVEQVLTHSAAVQVTIDGLPGFGFFSTVLRLVPRPLADFGYGFSPATARLSSARKTSAMWSSPRTASCFWNKKLRHPELVEGSASSERTSYWR